MTSAKPAWVDTHCHLDAPEFSDDRDQVYARASNAGMVGCIVPAIHQANWYEVRDCCGRYEKCVPAYGIHPLFSGEARPEHLALLADWLAENPAVAVGEIGLDGFVAGLDWNQQIFYFTEQLKLARQFELPVILHVRQAIDAVTHTLRRYPVKGGIAHAFNGSRQQADILIGMGFKLGFGGAMTYEGSKRIRQLAKDLPLSAIVLETDAPDIPPCWLDTGGIRLRNEPGELPKMANVLADLRRIPVDEVMGACLSNTQAVFQSV